MKSNILISLVVFAILIITVYSSRSYCRHPKIPSYGYIRKGHQNKYRIGNVVYFACQHGYKLAGSSSIKCIRHGNWNRRSPICKKIGKTFHLYVSFICLTFFRSTS